MTRIGKKQKNSTSTVPFHYVIPKLAKVASHVLSVQQVSNSDFHVFLSSTYTKKFPSSISLAKKVGFKGQVSRSSSIPRAVRRVAKRCAVMQQPPLQENAGSYPRFLVFPARRFAKKSASTIVLISVYDRTMHHNHHIQDSKLDSRSESNREDEQTHASLREADASSSCAIEISTDRGNLEDANDGMNKIPFKSISVIQRELPESSLGWPLLRGRTHLPRQKASRKCKARSLSLVEWIMSLPSQFSQLIMHNQTDSSSSQENNTCDDDIQDFVAEDGKTEGTRIRVIRNFQDLSIDESCNMEEEKFSFPHDVFSSSCSVVTEDLAAQSKPGWPLCRVKNSISSDSSEQCETTYTSFGNQSTEETPRSQISSMCKDIESSIDKDTCLTMDKHHKTCSIVSSELQKKLELVTKLKSSDCKLFTYEELKTATQRFAAAKLIGKGGCSNVYKGYLPSGKVVAVKVQKHYKEAWNDFFSEVEVMSSLKHKHITPLLGVCLEDDHLIMVNNFLSKGSLEENLHGKNRKSALPWKRRFEVAIAVAEALHYLHNENSRPIIHRDVKSSNILLSRDYQPQLSDFGLAIQGPEDSTYIWDCDLVGTFGYIAPEYFLRGMVSDKIDVYSFGIVLLELLTGKKPIISSKGSKGKLSLVQWAKPLLEKGNLEAFLDPKLNGDINIVQMHRMTLAATLCVKQTAGLRPTIRQILELLKGEDDEREWVNSYITELRESSDRETSDFFPESSFSEDTSLKIETRYRSKLKDYLKQPHD